jgi:hypothetical protein
VAWGKVLEHVAFERRDKMAAGEHRVALVRDELYRVLKPSVEELALGHPNGRTPPPSTQLAARLASSPKSSIAWTPKRPDILGYVSEQDADLVRVADLRKVRAYVS